jgi:hypothetical protein
MHNKQHREETKKLLSQLKRGQYLIHPNLKKYKSTF